MDTSSSPRFKASLKEAESKMSISLDGNCRIRKLTKLDEKAARIIKDIEESKFRSELRYGLPELLERSKRKGFMCLILYLKREPIGFVFGYDDEDQGVYYSDSSATLIERKGIGTLLSALEEIHCFEKGYNVVKLSTEEEDEVGRHLQAFWQRYGFRVDESSSNGTVNMILDLTPEKVFRLYEKYIASR